MKYEIPFRIVVSQPLQGVVMKVQRGRDELLPPTDNSDDSISFEFDLTVDDSSHDLNFLGKYAQGPKDARFIYVNSGTYAGQEGNCWSRRARLSLMSITRQQIKKAISSAGSRIEATIPGVGGDGGPTCASVKEPEWKVVRK